MIHHVQTACPPQTEDLLRGFYHGVLGFDEIAKPPDLAPRGGCWFRGHNGNRLEFLEPLAER
ncbi:MAG TPA: hypothetical protein VG253_02410 [Streptosporangiaceae bacterium]|nr:hypothetical protein [Streptosporangiaceae bacterium]